MSFKAKTSVLVVDDKNYLRRILRHAFEKYGCTTSEAMDIEQAVAIVRAEKPNIVVTDILRDDGTDGLMMARAMRKAGFQGEIHVFTGDTESCRDELDSLVEEGVIQSYRLKGVTDVYTVVRSIMQFN
ncbi:MAG: response regulator [Patescibacteria group bacterium]